MNIKRIAISLTTIGALAAAVFAGTSAFFSDTETSTGNILQAGALDLKIDNTCYYNSQACSNGFWGGKVAEGNECSCTWESSDLGTGHVFFNLKDLKPGDTEEDTISINVDNPSWLCADIKTTANDDVNCTEPELADDPSCTDPEAPGNANLLDGELAQNLNFIFWTDDGDNVFETNETEGLLSRGTADQILGDNKLALADARTGNGPIGPATYYIGKFFCYGDIGLNPVEPGEGSPVNRGSGFNCDGRPVNNASQTDMLTGDITFYAEQARHNDKFLCNPSTEQRLVLENEIITEQGPWTPITGDGISGLLTWAGDGPTFDYSLTAQGLQPSTGYSLIYYADPWPGNNPGAFIGNGTTDGSGNLAFAGNPNLNVDLPTLPDANFATGAKIWLVLTSDYNSGTLATGPMTGWQPDKYLFEGNVYIHYNDTDN